MDKLDILIILLSVLTVLSILNLLDNSKFEYKVVIFTDEKTLTGLNELGKQGWEVVSFRQVPFYSGTYYNIKTDMVNEFLLKK